jgi:rhodanese-related sulfurtransferase
MEYAHPEDHKRISYKLPLGGFLFVVVIIAGFLTMQEPEIKYTLNTEEIHNLVLQRNEIISPPEVAKIVQEGHEGYRLIDLRNPHEFISGHIEGAINIPANLILTPDNRRLFADPGFKNILYAESHATVCGPWMVLRQTGFERNLIMLGGYAQFNAAMDKDTATASGYQDEVARYNFAEIVRTTAGSGVSAPARPAAGGAIQVQKKQRKSAQGGC